MLPTKTARKLKEGDRIVLGQGDFAPIGVVDFVYKCHEQVHILVKREDAADPNYSECRSFAKTDVITLASAQ